jgi:hypothetical protein
MYMSAVVSIGFEMRALRRYHLVLNPLMPSAGCCWWSDYQGLMGCCSSSK